MPVSRFLVIVILSLIAFLLVLSIILFFSKLAYQKYEKVNSTISTFIPAVICYRNTKRSQIKFLIYLILALFVILSAVYIYTALTKDIYNVGNQLKNTTIENE